MKITNIHTSKLQIPLRTPFITSLRKVECIDDIVVAIQCDNNAVGYGEAPPTAVITGDTHGSILGAIDIIAPRLIGKDIEQFEELLEIVHNSIRRNTSAKAALEMALYDLWAQSLNLPLHKALGNAVDTLKTDLTISLNPLEKMVEDSLKAVERGFEHLKIKIGSKPSDDIARLTAICEAVGPKIKISIDANQGWSPSQAIDTMLKLEAAGLVFDYLEQPVHAEDINGLYDVTHVIKTPVLADETVFSSKDAKFLLDKQAANLINIKLMKSAGISDAINIAKLSMKYNIECMIGVMLEGPIGVGAAACFGASQHQVVTRFDLDGPMLAKYNPVKGGVLFDEADITLPTQAGLGIESVEGLEFIKEYK